MKRRTLTAKAVLLLGLISASFLSGCVVRAGVGEPREGYWDRGSHRYWHEHAWVACVGPEDMHCR
jgi:hypothetical protein